MKTQCDSCHKKAASVFCNLEETALCSSCDVHHIDPLARDHQHVAFFYPTKNNIPICDICQETKAFIFCHGHRAILCRLCDNSMHVKDEFVNKHNRFLLSGAKLCNDDSDGDKGSTTATPSNGMHGGGAVNQPANERCGSSTSSNINIPEHFADMPLDAVDKNLLDMPPDDDPYGLCKGEGDAFQDTDLGSYLSSLSPKNI